MKTKHIYTSLILLMLTLSGLFSTSAEAQEVHALLIILGNDSNIQRTIRRKQCKAQFAIFLSQRYFSA